MASGLPFLQFFSRNKLTNAAPTNKGVAGSGTAELPFADTDTSSSEKNPVSFLKLNSRVLLAESVVLEKLY